MAAVTIRKLPDEVHAFLKGRAKANGRSTEAEIREVLIKEAGASSRKGLGTELHEMWKKSGGWELELPARTGIMRPSPFEDRDENT